MNVTQLTPKPGVLNALTFDVEEWFQTILFNRNEHECKSNLARNVLEILNILDVHHVQATFFISGLVAERNACLVKEIHARGHEVGSHGYYHRLVSKYSPQAFSNDVARSIDILGSIIKTRIKGYRAPTWSIYRSMPWAIDVLKESGFKYDSSIYPVSKNIFLCKKLSTAPYFIRKDFIEFPPSVFRWMGYNLPFSGGTFLRVCPEKFILQKISDINTTGSPALAYFHSWEFDDHPPARCVPYWKKLVQYGFSKTVKIKLESVLNRFRFAPLHEVLDGMMLKNESLPSSYE